MISRGQDLYIVLDHLTDRKKAGTSTARQKKNKRMLSMTL